MNKAEFTIQDILRAIISHLWIILATAVVFGAIAWVYTTERIPKMYQVSVTFYAVGNAQQENSSINTGEISTSRMLASTYAFMFRTNSVMKAAADKLEEIGYPIGFEAIKAMTTVSTTNTEIFTATFSSSDKEHLKLIANTVADVGVAWIKEIVGSGGAKILDYAEDPKAPYSPNVRAHTVTGALVGFLLAAVIVVIRLLTDTTIWDEEDLTKQYSIPVLGSIPLLTSLEKQGEGKE